MGPLKTNGFEISPIEFDLPTFQFAFSVQQFFSGQTNCRATLLRSNERGEFCGSRRDVGSHPEKAIPVPLPRGRYQYEEGEVF